jgi:hypothetical protein
MHLCDLHASIPALDEAEGVDGRGGTAQAKIHCPEPGFESKEPRSFPTCLAWAAALLRPRVRDNRQLLVAKPIH